MASRGGKKEPILPKKPKVQRDANGKLIITYTSRLLKPKQHDEEWRAKKLAHYEKLHQDALASGKGSMLGYFGPARSASAGDFFVEKAKHDAKHARGKGPQLRSGARQSKVVSGTFGKFVSNASGDPYMSASQVRAQYRKAQKAKAIQTAAFAAGKRKTKMVTGTFSQPRFLSEVDGDADIGALKEKIKNAKASMAEPLPKFQQFKQPNFRTAPVKKGGPGMAGVLMPVYAEGDDDKLRRINQYVESPYEAAREAELARRKDHEERMKAVHGDSPKPFAGRVSSKGVPTFSKDVELYGEDKETVAMIKAKQEKQAAARKKAEEVKAAKGDDDEPPPQWRPSNPPKKMQYADKKAFFGGSVFEYVADPVPEFQPGAHLPKKKEHQDGQEEMPRWVPNGSHSHGHKGTASVILNPAHLRHQIYTTNLGDTARSTTR